MNFIENIKDEKMIKKILRSLNQKFDLFYNGESHTIFYNRTLTTEDYISVSLNVVTTDYQLNLHAYYTEKRKLDTCKGSIILKKEESTMSEEDVMNDAYDFIKENWEDIFKNELEKVTDSINYILSTKQNFLN